MLLNLSTKNKLGFVDGSITKPAENSPDLKAWNRCNDLVCSWILSSLDETIATSVLYFANASEIWFDLEDRFGIASMAQVYALEQQLTDLAQGCKTVSQFFTEIKILWDAMTDASPLECCTCNKCICNVNQRIRQRQQNHRLIQFMINLGDRFSAIRGNILMQQPLPPMSAAFRLFSQEERHQEIAHLTSNTESLAFVADNRNFKTKSVSGTTGNTQKQASGSAGTTRVKRNSKYYCTHCKMSGHSIERCFKVHGYPPGYKLPKDKKVAAVSCGTADEDGSPPISLAQYNQLMSLLNNQQTSSSSRDGTDHAMLAGKFCFMADHPNKLGWLIDSGATDHICSNIDDFVSHKPLQPVEYITIPDDGKKVAIKNVGTVQLNSNMLLHNVLHVPEFQFNLLSVKRLCKDFNCEVLFTPDKCLLQGLSQKNSQMLLGNIHGGLYSVHNTCADVSTRSCHAAVVDATTWHLRLGHIPFSRLKLAIPDVQLPSSCSEMICQICPKAKQTKASFPHSYIKTNSSFELIHIDIWGPYQVKTQSGCNQFLTIVDDYTIFTWIHLIKHKTDCVQVMHSFLQYVENRFGTHVVTVRSDNASEFCHGEMAKLFQ